MAVAGLAFTCLERSNLNSDLRHRITLAIRTAQEKVLKAQTPEGYFGNVYSTPLALQVGQRLWDCGPPGGWWEAGSSGTGRPGFSLLADPPLPPFPHSVTSC